MLSNLFTYTSFHLLLHNLHEVLKLFKLCTHGLKEQLKPGVKQCEVK